MQDQLESLELRYHGGDVIKHVGEDVSATLQSWRVTVERHIRDIGDRAKQEEDRIVAREEEERAELEDEHMQSKKDEEDEATAIKVEAERLDTDMKRARNIFARESERIEKERVIYQEEHKVAVEAATYKREEAEARGAASVAAMEDDVETKLSEMREAHAAKLAEKRASLIKEAELAKVQLQDEFQEHKLRFDEEMEAYAKNNKMLIETEARVEGAEGLFAAQDAKCKAAREAADASAKMLKEETISNMLAMEKMEKVHLTELKEIEADEDKMEKEVQMKRAESEALLVEDIAKREREAEESLVPLAEKRAELNERRKEKIAHQGELERGLESLRHTAEEAAANARGENDDLDAKVKTAEEDAKKLVRRLREEEAAVAEELEEKLKALTVTWGAEAESIEREHQVVESSAQYKIESLKMDADRRYKDYADDNAAELKRVSGELEAAEKQLDKDRSVYEKAKAELDEVEGKRKAHLEESVSRKLAKNREAAEAIANKQKAADEASGAISAAELAADEAAAEADEKFEGEREALNARRAQALSKGDEIRARWHDERAARTAKFEAEWQSKLEVFQAKKAELEAGLGPEDVAEMDAEVALGQAKEVQDIVTRQLEEHQVLMAAERKKLDDDLARRLEKLEEEEIGHRKASEAEISAHEGKSGGALGTFDEDLAQLKGDFEAQRQVQRQRMAEYEAKGVDTAEKLSEMRVKREQAARESHRAEEKAHVDKQEADLEMDKWTEQVDSEIAPLKKVVAKAKSVAAEISMFQHRTEAAPSHSLGYEESELQAEAEWIRQEANLELDNIDRLEQHAKDQLEVRRQAHKEVLRLERHEIEMRLADRIELIRRKRVDMKRAVERRLKGLDKAGERLKELKAEAAEALAEVKSQVGVAGATARDKERSQLKLLRDIEAEEALCTRDYEGARATFEGDNNKQEQKVEAEAVSLVVAVDQERASLLDRHNYELRRRGPKSMSTPQVLERQAGELRAAADVEERRQEEEKRALELEVSARQQELGVHQAEVEARVAGLHVAYRHSEQVAIALRQQQGEITTVMDRRKKDFYGEVTSAEDDLTRRRRDVDDRRARHEERKAAMRAALETERAESEEKLAGLRVKSERAHDRVKEVERLGLDRLGRLRALRDNAEAELQNETLRVQQQERRWREELDREEAKVSKDEEAVAEDLRSARAALQQVLKDKNDAIDHEFETQRKDVDQRREDLEARRKDAAERAKERDEAREKLRAESEALALTAAREAQAMEDLKSDLEECRQLLEERREEIEEGLRSKKRAENIFTREQQRKDRDTEKVQSDMDLELAELDANGKEEISRAEHEGLDRLTRCREGAESEATRARLHEAKERAAQDQQLNSALGELDSLKTEAEQELGDTEVAVRAAMKERAEKRKRDRQRRADGRSSARKASMERHMNDEFRFEEDMDGRLEKLLGVWQQLQVQREREQVARDASVEAEKARRLQAEIDAVNAERALRLTAVQTEIDRQRAEARLEEARRRREVEEELLREQAEQQRRWEERKRERLAVIEADRAMKRDQLRGDFEEQREKLEKELAALEVERTNKIREMFGEKALPVPRRPSSAYATKFRDQVVRERVQDAEAKAAAEKQAELSEFEAEKRRMFEELAMLDAEMAEIEAAESAASSSRHGSSMAHHSARNSYTPSAVAPVAGY